MSRPSTGVVEGYKGLKYKSANGITRSPLGIGLQAHNRSAIIRVYKTSFFAPFAKNIFEVASNAEYIVSAKLPKYYSPSVNSL